MNTKFLYLVLTAIVIGAVSGCKKYNEVDNSSTVETPYILYIGGYNGTLHKTNDATYFNANFHTDNSPVRQVIIADTNILYLKQNCYFSKNEGLAFQLNNNHTLPYVDLFYKYYLPYSMVYDKNNREVFLCTRTGLEKSTDLGASFSPETNWDPAPPLAGLNYQIPPFNTITGEIPLSITQLDNSDLYCLGDSAHLYQKLAGSGTKWKQLTPTTPLPNDSALWYLSHQGNTLIAIDFIGTYGIYNSTDGGMTWVAYTGVPKSRKLLFGNTPSFSNNTFFVGIDSVGIIKQSGTGFTGTGAGIPLYCKPGMIEGKRNIYRNGYIKNFLFCATDQGLFISYNNGEDWKLIWNGFYSTLQ